MASALALADTVRDHAAVGAPQIAQVNAANSELALGRVEEAEARTRAAIAALEPLTLPSSALGYARGLLAACEARRGDWLAALASSRLARPALEIEGDDLLLLPTLAFCAVGLGRADAAARIVGHLDTSRARIADLPEPAAAAERARLQLLLAAALDCAALEAAQAAGARMSRAEVFALGLFSPG